jgi:TRAP-type C4-dicarboxylate transport system substrate-binding protein
VPLYATTFAWVINKDRYNQMSAGQKKVIDDHCNTEWALKVAGPWSDFEREGIAKLKADPAHEVYPISPDQLAEWRKAAEPLQKSWADNVRKAGVNPDSVIEELKAALTQYQAVY